MVGGLEIWLLVLGLLLWLYKWATDSHKVFQERRLPYEKPWPVVGNMGAVLTGKMSMQKQMIEFYARTRMHKLLGIFSFRTPMIQINDPEIIKKITVKDFDSFPNHNVFLQSKEPLFSDMLSMMKDQRWKNMRNTLSPVFTAAKMRSMFVLMNDCFAECIQHLGTLSTNGAGFDVELKEVCNRLSNDLIATTAFGLKVNSYKDRENEFFLIGQSIAKFRGLQQFKFMMAMIVPTLFNLLGIKIFDSKKIEFFMSLVVDTMKYREENKIVRPDMIQLLMETKKESSTQWTDREIVAQCFVFFFAAFENNASLICTTTYELLQNPEVQQKLYEEVLETEAALKGEHLNYDAVQKMKYMDMVVSESLRKWPLAIGTDRLCSKDYILRDDDDTVLFEFKVGDRINIPIMGIHWDDRYFPEPLKFDPERFSESQKDNQVPYSYIPFGAGPRICIANRYALMQAKAMIYNLLLNYKLDPAPGTSKDLLADSVGFQLLPKNGFLTHLVPRK